MFILSLLLALRKTPRVLLLVLTFITLFLLSFLLAGCTKTSSTYSEVYLTSFQFNSSSEMYSLIEESYDEQDASSLTSMKVMANYLSLCVKIESDDDDTEITCSSKDELDKFSSFTGVSFFDSSTNSSLATMDLIEIASQFSNDVMKPYVLVATLICNIFLLFNILYCVCKFLPFHQIAVKFSLVLSPLSSVLWGYGCMWNYIASNSVKDLVSSSSMYIVSCSTGGRAQAMTWISLVLMMLVTAGCFYLFVRDRRAAKKEADLQAQTEKAIGGHIEKKFGDIKKHLG